MFVCIGHRVCILARYDSIFPLLRCQGVRNKTCTQLSLSQILFQNQKNYSLGMFKDSAFILDVIRQSFLTKSATAAMFTSVRVDFGRSPLSSTSTSYLPSRNLEYHLKRFIGSQPHSYKPFAQYYCFCRTYTDFETFYLQISVQFRHPRGMKKTDFTRQVITRTMSKINKRNSVCERTLVDST